MQDAVLVDLAATACPGVDVLFLETGYHFAETLGTRDAVAHAYAVKRRQREGPALTVALAGRRRSARTSSPATPTSAARCARSSRSTETLAGYDAWVTGVRRAEAPTRANTPLVTWDEKLGLVKLNPIAALDRRGHGRPTSREHGDAREPAGRARATRRSGARRAPPSRCRAPTRAAAGGRAPARPSAGCTDDRSPRRATALSHWALESEAIHIFREVAGEFDRPVILFSGGKDSTLLVHLAVKAFAPAPVPFPLLHVDTGHNFPEVIEFRDARRRAARACACTSRTCRTRSTTAGSSSAPTAPATRCRPSRCSTPSSSTASTRSSAAVAATRSGRGPRSGSSQPARRVRPVGPAQPAAGAVEPLQRTARARRARAGVPDLELDRAGRLALHRAREHRAAVDLLRPRRARCSAATACGWPRGPGAARGTGSGRAQDRALPHGRRRLVHRRRRVAGAPVSTRSSPR